MADLNVDSIGDASGGNTATINSYTPTESNMAGRNRIINGDMRISQRGTSFTYTGTNSYNLDRYLTDMSPGGSLQIQQVADAPDGFVYSMKGTILTATAGSSGQAAYLARHVIEGNNVADLGWGTANAKPVTISFWVKSSVTGTFAVGVSNGDFNRGYPATYMVSSANTWEYKTITIPGNTSGTWLTTNGSGIRLYWDIGSGSNYTQAANSWVSSGVIGATGTTSIINTLNATFQITGVQLEVGSVATPFEHRQYGQELALCQRYYNYATNMWMSGQSYGTNGSSDGLVQVFRFPTEMRANPTITFSGGSHGGSAASLHSGGVSTSHVNINLRSQTGGTSVWYSGFKTTAEAEL